MPAGELHCRILFGEVGKITARDDRMLHAALLCEAEQPLQRGDVVFFEKVVDGRWALYPLVYTCGKDEPVHARKELL
ncbi:hypothetical protein SDC9_187061 [bioreactor metagenome]|uniref:Uncharacterized protein n=1 Tax=bioreactor metagenome TaxID=1076179 RepID=A0A645HW07_9ZZZZ